MNSVATISDGLDSDELLHLAMNAMNQGKAEDSLNYLHRALELDPSNGKVQYLLGAVHAELGMYDRAAEEMTKAIAIEPTLYTAHFQLGLIHLTSGRFSEAEAAWTALDALALDHPLYLFKTGLLHLIKDEFDECTDCLSKGISGNTMNVPLNDDMQRIIIEVEKTKIGTSELTKSMQPQEIRQGDAGKHVLLSAYQQDKDN